jgi:HD superfamily phosphodiesterase
MENIHGIKPWLWEFAKETITLYNMDSSHGLQHFINTCSFLKQLLPEFEGRAIIKDIDNITCREILIDAAFSHDLIDGKYMDENEGLQRFRRTFLRNKYDPEHLEIVVHIITTMSFSKRKARLDKGLPMIEPGPYALATGIVIDADQLDAYDPERCRIYQETKYLRAEYADLSLAERAELAHQWRATILIKRVLMYKNHYMNTETAKKLAEPLHNSLVEYVSREFNNVKFIDY